jgi:thiol-disulfide isomerase/thioredoxin
MKAFVSVIIDERLLLKISVVAILAILIFSCKEDDAVVINVDIESSHSYLEGKKVFLGDQATKEFLDSAIVKDGKFRFSVNTGKDFVPFEAAMLYATGDKNNPYWLLGYKNPFKEKTHMSSFYADRGTMNFVVDSTSKMPKKEIIELEFVNINRQTEAAYKRFNFSRSAGDKSKAYNAKIIKQYPNSIDLLKQLSFQKNELGDIAVKDLLILFDKSVHISNEYQQLVHHTSYQDKEEAGIPQQVALFRPDSSTTSAILDDKKHNLVVFWASWCGPCRKEIPQIRKLFDEHGNKLNIVSVSIDKRDEAWRKAMEAEKMPWSQLLLKQDSSFVKFDRKYDLKAIPVWVLVDGQGKTIARQVGYSDGENAIDKRVITYLNK